MIEEAVVAVLLNSPGVVALCGNAPLHRIYPLAMPQDADRPAIVYQKIDSPKTTSHSGRSDLARSRFQFTCAGNSYAEVKALAAAVRDCWWGFRGTAAGVRIDGALIEDEGDSAGEMGAMPVTRLDVIIWHSE